MLDVHILVSDMTRREWVEKCLESVSDAAAQAGFPVGVYVVPISDGTRGHIGRGRKQGYALGAYPYVTNVDDDDWVDKNAFALLARGLEKGPVAVTTQCEMHQNGLSQGVKPWRNLLRVFRRDVALSAPLEAWPVYDAPMMLAHADAIGRVEELECAPYHYRLHLSPHRQLMGAITAEMRQRITALPSGIHLARVSHG